MNYSKYQKAIFEEVEHTRNSILIKAVAGSGKTTTAVESMNYIKRGEKTIFLAFNKSIVETLRSRLPDYVDVSTLHSFGCRYVMKYVGGCVIDENKVFKHCLKLFSLLWHSETTENKYVYCDRIARIVSLMKLTLSLTSEKIEDVCNKHDIFAYEKEIEHAIQVFKYCVKDLSKIDFEDMIFLPVYLNIRLPKFDNVIVDEVQDTNICQHKFIKKLLHPSTGRLIAFGDPRQAIYGFAGADFNSFQKLKDLPGNKVVDMPLSICYRCGKDIVEHAKHLVPEIEESNEQVKGKVINAGIKSINLIKEGDVVLCRNTRPLVQLFRKLISQHKKAHIKGRDIGLNLITLIDKMKRNTMDGLMKQLKLSREEVRVKLLKRGYYKWQEHPQYQQFDEKVKIIEILGRDTNNVKILKDRIKNIFVDKIKDGIILSTIHKFKGLEADNVFFLYRDLIPNQYANTADEILQEQNLLYVAITRARKKLIYIDPEEKDLEV